MAAFAAQATGGVGGAVVGCSLGGRRIIVVHTEPGYEAVHESSVFELGSITKSFTGVALAAMVGEGDLRFAEPVASFFRDRELPLRWDSITLEQLASHTSGLPVLPPNLRGALWNPYDGWDAEDLFEAMAIGRNESPPGERARYSNFGFAVLSAALAERATLTYTDVVRTRIAGPLQLRHLAPSADPVAPVAAGHDRWGRPDTTWNFSAMTGAGGLSCTTTDLLTYGESMLAHGTDGLPAALRLAGEPRAQLAGSTWAGLGWMASRIGSIVIPWTRGCASGSSSYLAVHERSGTVLAALTTVAKPDRLTRIGFTILAQLVRHARHQDG